MIAIMAQCKERDNMTDIEIKELITKINQLSKERRIKFNIYNTGETLDLIQICYNTDKNTLELSFRDEGKEYVDELKKLSEEINLKLQKIEDMKKRHKTYKEWKDEYEHKEIVNLSNEFSKKEIEIINKLGYKIEEGKSYSGLHHWLWLLRQQKSHLVPNSS